MPQKKGKQVRTVSIENNGRKMKTTNGEFSVSVKGKKVKPTKQDSAFWNTAANTANGSGSSKKMVGGAIPTLKPKKPKK